MEVQMEKDISPSSFVTIHMSIEKSIKWPWFWILISPPNPYFNLKPCHSQNEGVLLNQGWHFVPQDLMYKIQNNCGNSKHSKKEGVQGGKKKDKVKLRLF